MSNFKASRFLAFASLLIFALSIPALGQPDTDHDWPFPNKSLITSEPLTQVTDSIAPKTRFELFNGNDLTGWVFCMKDNAEPGKTWSVTNGVLQCSGAAVGYLRNQQRYHDYKLTVEWRFVKMSPKADNTGVLLHIQEPDKVWPECVQVQGKHERQGDLFLMAGAESKEHRGKDANTAIPLNGESVEKPVGEWNTCQAVCHGNSVQAIINGKLLNEITECTVTNGTIGIQSEGSVFEIRKIFVEPLK